MGTGQPPTPSPLSWETSAAALPWIARAMCVVIPKIPLTKRNKTKKTHLVPLLLDASGHVLDRLLDRRMEHKGRVLVHAQPQEQESLQLEALTIKQNQDNNENQRRWSHS